MEYLNCKTVAKQKILIRYLPNKDLNPLQVLFSLTGNPTILAFCFRFVGFASPPFDGFALFYSELLFTNIQLNYITTLIRFYESIDLINKQNKISLFNIIPGSIHLSILQIHFGSKLYLCCKRIYSRDWLEVHLYPEFLGINYIFKPFLYSIFDKLKIFPPYAWK